MSYHGPEWLEKRRAVARKGRLSVADINASLKDRDLMLVGNYTTIRAKTTFRHLACGYTWEAFPNNLLNRDGRCPRCSPRGSDNDCFYLVQYAESVFKAGVASWADGERRMLDCAARHGAEVEIRRWRVNDARALEQLVLHTFTLRPEIERRDGWTEFRVLSPSEVNEIVTLAEAHALA